MSRANERTGTEPAGSGVRARSEALVSGSRAAPGGKRAPDEARGPFSSPAARRRLRAIPWLPLLACATGSALSVMIWNELRSSEERALATTLESTSTELARSIESRSREEFEALRLLGLTWSEFGTGDVSRWESEAKSFMKRYEEFAAIEWELGSPTASPPLSAGSEVGLQILAVRRGSPEAAEARRRALEEGGAILGPFSAPQGGEEAGARQLCELVLPFGKARGGEILTAILQPAVMLEAVLRHRAGEYSLSVSIAGEEVLERGARPAEHGAVKAQERPFSLHSGAKGSLSVWPEPETLDSMRSRTPWFVLAAGVAFSALLAFLLQMGQTSSAREKESLSASVELEARKREIDRADEQNRALAQQNAALSQESLALEKELARLQRRTDARETELAAKQDMVVSELEAFTYSVSHDLRSPLGAILNYTAILAEDYQGKLDETALEQLGRISSSARMAVSMMDALLAFSRIGRQELKLATVDVRALVREIHEELCQAHPEKPPRLSMGELPAIQADRALIRVLFGNLVSNAFKFTRKVEDPHLEIGGYADGTESVYYVKDNGVGFEMRDAGKLFGVFERLHKKEEYEGHGVGLALVRRIAYRHGGRVRVESALGKGTTFFVTLPSEPAPRDRPEDAA